MSTSDVVTGNPSVDLPTINQNVILLADFIVTDPPVVGSPATGVTTVLSATPIVTPSPVVGTTTVILPIDRRAVFVTANTVTTATLETSSNTANVLNQNNKAA